MNSARLLEAIQGVEARLGAKIDALDQRFDGLQDQINNLSVAFVGADLIAPPDDAVAEKALREATEEARKEVTP